jgi:hypothetical protein
MAHNINICECYLVLVKFQRNGKQKLTSLTENSHFKTQAMKYTILFLAAVIIEIASTFYISAVSDRQLVPMVFWAFIGPFLGLPFIAYQIEAKNNTQRFYLALCYGLGYAVGAALVNILN